MEGRISSLFLKNFNFCFLTLCGICKHVLPTSWERHPLHGGQAQCGELQCRPASLFKQLWLLESPLGTCASSLCKLQLSTHLCSSNHTRGHHRYFLMLSSLLLWRQLRCWEESCYASKPWKDPIPMPNICWCSSNFISDCSRYLKTLRTLHSADIYDRELETKALCWEHQHVSPQLLKQTEAIFSKYQPGQGFNLHYGKSRIFSASLWII